MFKPGDKVHFLSDEKKEVLTVKTVSPDGLIFETEEFQPGYSWVDSAVLSPHR